MIFSEKTIYLKDGTPCLLRSPKPEDASNMLKYLITCAQETDFILRYPEECIETIEEEARFLQSINESPYNLMLVATVNDKIVGNAHITLKKRLKVMHRASVGIAIIKDYWNKGLGTQLLTHLIEVVKTRNVEQVELEVIASNTRAIALYQKLGFVITGTRIDGIKLKNGSYLDEHIMVLKIS